jgi:hypothetical protein
MRRKSAKDKELDDRNRLARAWRKWHREQLEAALAGIHGAVLARLTEQLKHLGEARALVEFISVQDWEAVDSATRLVALHEINTAITKLREKRGLDPIADPMPGAPANAFQIIKSILQFPVPAGKLAEGVKQRSLK